MRKTTLSKCYRIIILHASLTDYKLTTCHILIRDKNTNRIKFNKLRQNVRLKDARKPTSYFCNKEDIDGKGLTSK